MRHGSIRARSALWIGLLGFGPGLAAAAHLNLRVLDRDGAPVPEVAVYAIPAGAGSPSASQFSGETSARRQPGRVMNQHNLSFDPHILVVETGTAIAFPNNDEVRHHVYSFSNAKRFELSIDSGHSYAEELTFDSPGIVTLGCNIHDNMLAYILVVDTAHFAMTDQEGIASLSDLPPGDFEIRIWTPRLPEKKLPEPFVVSFTPSDSLELEHRIAEKLYPPHQHSQTSLLWPDY